MHRAPCSGPESLPVLVPSCPFVPCLSACAIFFPNSPGSSRFRFASPLSSFCVSPKQKLRLQLLTPSSHNGVLNSAASKPFWNGIRLLMRDKFSVFGLSVSGPMDAVGEDRGGILRLKLPGVSKSDNSFPGLLPSGHVTCFHYGFPPNSAP